MSFCTKRYKPFAWEGTTRLVRKEKKRHQRQGRGQILGRVLSFLILQSAQMFPSVIDAETSQSGFLSILRAGILWCCFAEYLLLNVLLSEGRYFLDSAHATQPKLALPALRIFAKYSYSWDSKQRGELSCFIFVTNILFVLSSSSFRGVLKE